MNSIRKSTISCRSETDNFEEEIDNLNNLISEKCEDLAHLFFNCGSIEEKKFLKSCIYSFDSDNINTLTSWNNQLDNLLKQDKTGLISSIQSATQENKVLHILKGVLDEVGFDWNKYTKPQRNLPSPPQNQGLNNNQKPSEENKPLVENKLKKFFLPVTGVVSIIGTLLFLFWNKLSDTQQPTSPDSKIGLKDTKPAIKAINLKQILQSSAGT